LKAIAKKVHYYGGYLIVDGTQSIGALPFDVKEIDADVVICAGYKWLLGPYAIALGYFNERFDGGTPIEENWINRKDSDQFENLINYQSDYQPKAGRYNVGENSNFIYVAMLNRSMAQILEWGVDNIQEYCANLLEPFVNRFGELGCTIEESKFRSSHLFGIRIPGDVDVKRLKDELANRNIFVSIRGDSVRVSTHLFNEPRHLEMLHEALSDVLSAETA
ncbi:MAG: aminotransferase class V-fold PLP-dependent enzyme, partial [Flavobacteriales bacterium]|nr:aminotransferase class V-fold PLP-dependent enzyme [Flavobacteriales bacterium]